MGKKKRERDVEVERMADLGGWEYFKAIDGASERERWTLALRHEVKASALEYALWWDLEKDPEATGTLDARKGSKEAWAVALRDAATSPAATSPAATSPEGASPADASALDDDAREELIVAVLARHDSSFEDYRDRLLFVLAAHDDEADEGGEAEDDDSDSDDEDEDDDSDSDDDSDEEEDDDDDDE